jgi:hypothetical protein
MPVFALEPAYLGGGICVLVRLIGRFCVKLTPPYPTKLARIGKPLPVFNVLTVRVSLFQCDVVKPAKHTDVTL